MNFIQKKNRPSLKITGLWLGYLSSLLLVYSLFRFLFACLYSAPVSLKEGLTIFYWGIRMDWAAVFYTNLLFCIIILFAGFLWAKKGPFANSFFFLLFLFNFLLMLPNLIDLAYFRHSRSRMRADSLLVAEEAFGFWRGILRMYWPILLLIIVSAAYLWYITAILKRKLQDAEPSQCRHLQWLAGWLFVSVAFLLARGIGKLPIQPSTPLLYLPASRLSLVQNSGFNFLYSLARNESRLTEPFGQNDAITGYPGGHQQQFGAGNPFARRNIVLFILESISAPLLEAGSPVKAKTPFLDSLQQHSYVCTNTFSNSFQSNQGIVSIMGSLPPFFDRPFYYSSYNQQRFTGIGSLLKAKGYTTLFALGAEYDHFGFGKWMKMVGMENYLSKADYPVKGREDGNWGVFDHYFLPYVGERLKQQPKPFFATVYNLSTHPPFTVPEQFKRRGHSSSLEDYRNSVSYLDYAMRLFFREIDTTSWFKNTIFVFVADHALSYELVPDQESPAALRIPFFIYDPQLEAPVKIEAVAQQTDVVPTIMDFIHYPGPFISFGKSVFRKGDRLVFFQRGRQLQVIEDQRGVSFNLDNNKTGDYYLKNPAGDWESKIPATGQNRDDSLSILRLKGQGEAFYRDFVRAVLGDALGVP